MVITAFAASNPLLGFLLNVLLHLCMACLILYAVIIPLPIGLLKVIERFKIELNVDEHIKSKCGVWPLITQPKATNPSKFLIFFLIAIGIS